MYKRFGKRLLDIAVGVCSLPFVAVAFAICAPLIKLSDGGPVFYNAPRRGYKGKVFTMYKFRSMKVGSPVLKNADGSTLSSGDDPRLTKFGHILRKTSLDEFPQFINVLKGDMSIVGPRPNMPGGNYDQFDDVRKKRLEVRPGITGYNQAYFRNSVDMDTKFMNDCYYVDHCSLLFDLKILGRTFASVLSSKNVDYSDMAK